MDSFPSILCCVTHFLRESFSGGGASLVLSVTSTMTFNRRGDVVMQQQRRIVGLFFFLGPAQNRSLPVPCWPVAMAILSVPSPVDTMACCPLPPYWSAGPKRGPPMRWQETV